MKLSQFDGYLFRPPSPPLFWLERPLKKSLLERKKIILITYLPEKTTGCSSLSRTMSWPSTGLFTIPTTRLIRYINIILHFIFNLSLFDFILFSARIRVPGRDSYTSDLVACGIRSFKSLVEPSRGVALWRSYSKYGV
jgi:hypothetical protein